MRAILLPILAIAFSSSTAPAAEAKSRTWPCSWLHGRMAFVNGTPSVRIWPRGTHRLLGVVNPNNPRSDVGELDTLPSNVLRLLGDNNFATMWGDFYVCPVAPDREGYMRFVVVKRARRLFLEEADKG